MPRLRKTTEQIREEELVRKDRSLMAIIKKNMALRGWKDKDLAAAIGMPNSTYCCRAKSPSEFRRKELIAIFTVLDISDTDKREIEW